MRKIIAVLMATVASASIAYVIAVAAPGNTNYTSAGTVGFRTTTDGTTNCVGATACNLANITIWDSVAGATGLTINSGGSISIYDLNDAANAVPVAGTGTGSASTLTNLFSVDTTGYNGISIEVTANPGGNTITFEASNDNSTWTPAVLINQAGNAATQVLSSTVTTVPLLLSGSVAGRYFRARISTVVSGTTTVSYALRRTMTSSVLPIAMSGGTVNPATPANWGISATAAAPPANGVTVQCSVTTTAPTYTTGQVNPFSCDTAGNTRVLVTNSNANGSAAPASSSPVVNAQTTPVILNGMTNTAKTIKGSAGQLVMIQCYNPNAAVTYAQIYNNAAPTIGTGVILSFGIAPTSTGGFALPGGIQFATAITAAATTTATGSTAPTTPMDCNASYM